MNKLSERTKNGFPKRNGFILEGQATETTDSECCQTSFKYAGLHRFKCLPSHLQFNKFVLSGYRLNLSTWQCLKSLLYVHNETFNVYSHGLACLFFLLVAPYVYHEASFIQLYPLLYSIHYVSSVLCVFCSATYHLMMCHSNGANTYGKLIKMDMIGIWFVSTFGPTAFVYGTFYCFPRLFKVILAVYSLLAMVGFIQITRGRNAAERLRPLIYLGAIRLPLYATRGFVAWSGYVTGQVGVVWFLVAMEMFALLGSFINVNRFPEKWFCGKLDYLGNSHNIMHIIVLICPVLLHFATVADFKWMETAQCSG